jgi:uncharacterized membrane protein YfcA
MSPIELLGGLLVGIIAGLISGSLGVGGGLVMVPAMVLLMGVSQQTAQGTSLLVIIPTALSGAYAHYRHGLLRQRLTPAVGLLGALGTVGGSYLALHLGGLQLRRVFAVYLVIVGVRAILARGSGASPSA